MLLGIGPEIELKAREREIDTKRSGQNESQRVLRREPEGDQGRESDTYESEKLRGGGRGVRKEMLAIRVRQH